MRLPHLHLTRDTLTPGGGIFVQDICRCGAVRTTWTSTGWCSGWVTGRVDIPDSAR